MLYVEYIKCLQSIEKVLLFVLLFMKEKVNMKKIYVILLGILLVLTGCTTTSKTVEKPTLVQTEDADPEGGADAYENAGDHYDSPYYTHPDFYNLTSNGSLVIFPKYQPTIQTTEWSCGPSAALGALNYLGITDYSEIEIANIMGTVGRGTAVGELVDFFRQVEGLAVSDTSYIETPTADQLTDESYGEDAGQIIGKWSSDSLYDGTFISFLKENITNDRVMLVEWVDWDGHWQAVIGYDDLGTDDVGDDVLIFADPYDTSDHWQDGYYTYSLERFFYMWNDRNVAETPYKLQQYLVVEKTN